MIAVLRQRIAKAAIHAFLISRSRLRKNPTKAQLLYFGYGANLDPDRFRRYRMNFECLGPARLSGHRIEFSLPSEYLMQAYASVAPDPSSEVWGYLYRLDRPSFLLLDIMEWASFGVYRKEVASVALPNGESHQATFYVANSPQAGRRPPKSYLDKIIRSSEAHCFPESYLKHLRSFESQERFELDHSFSLFFYGRTRPFSKKLRPLYRVHDRAREWVADQLRW